MDEYHKAIALSFALESGKIDSNDVCIIDKDDMLKSIDILIKDENKAVEDYRKAQLNVREIFRGLKGTASLQSVIEGLEEVFSGIRKDESIHITSLESLKEAVEQIPEC